MKEFHFQQETFGVNKDVLYDLSIQASLDGFSFIFQRVDSNDIEYFQYFPAQFTNYSHLLRNFREITESDAISNREVNKVSIILSDRNFSLVPPLLYSDKLLGYLFPAKQKQDARDIIVNHLEHPDATLTFSIPKSIADFVIEKFPGCSVEHAVSRIISNFYPAKEVLYIHFHTSWFYALTGMDSQHFYVNSFEFREETDILYYLSAIIQQLGLTGNPVFLSGLISQDDEKYIFLKKNLPRVEILKSLPGKKIDLNTGGIPFQLLPGMIIF
jgi:hypothetical protein